MLQFLYNIIQDNFKNDIKTKNYYMFNRLKRLRIQATKYFPIKNCSDAKFTHVKQ